MSVITYKCPGCGGPLLWDGAKGKYICEYCRSEYTEEKLRELSPEEAKAQEMPSGEAFHEASSDQSGNGTKKPEKIKAYVCPSCGAEIVTDATTAASFCYYCHNPVVIEDRLTGEFDPDFIIPFAFDRKKALEILREWIKHHKYIPDGFYNEDQIEKFSGVYFPYWVYNCRIFGTVSGTGDILRTWTDGRLQHTETSVYRIERNGQMPIKDLSRIALKKASKVLCESVMPYENEGMKEFEPGYLQGYVAEMRDVEKSEIEESVRNEIENYAKEELKASVSSGYNSVSIQEMNTEITGESFKYALMPVWTLTYRAKGDKLYYFSINGQTGKTCGELPVDGGKLLRLFLLVFVPAFIIMLLMFWFLF